MARQKVAGAKGKQWLTRLTGFSVPFFGVQWQPKPADRDTAQELLLRLEDRRVLYSPSEAEIPHHCVESVIQIRHMLSELLVRTGGNGPLAEHLRALMAASRRFLDRLARDGGVDYGAITSLGHWRSWDFQDALGQMRGIFGVHIALICAGYDLMVSDELMVILPPDVQDDELAPTRLRF